jgi:prenyltransferase beta subunit
VGVAELTPAAERAIDKGLQYLASRQNRDGSWDDKYQAASTSCALMAFMLKGHFPKAGRHGAQLDRAVTFLIRRADERGGYLGGTSHGMYEHGLATLALSEVWGMSDNEKIRDTLKRAVQIILRSQNREGGWRYHPRPEDADLSVTVMQIVALASAQEAGILVPNSVIKNAVRYVKKCQHPYEGGFGYQPNYSQLRVSSSAAGVMSLLMCGERKSRAVQKGLDYLRRQGDDQFEKTEFYYYAHYYAVQAMYQAGERYYQEWYPRIHDALVRKQNPKDGSWSGGRGGYGYSTSMAILILGVPYRFLPIYQR